MAQTDGAAAVWEEEIVIPTYLPGAPNRNPMFLEKRVYQGSSGAVYPFAVVDSVSDERVDVAYRAVFLENEYLKIMVLPGLGGRIQMAYAKWLDYHFVYYNRVIKPALVGLAGPWISGGIEFNWPQHHRPSTFSPVEFALEKRADGCATVWLGEIDRMNRTKGTLGLSLAPGLAYLKVEGRLFNPTGLPQSFLWWANPSVAVNDRYQAIFPPDVEAVFDHGKRDVSQFPIARGTYYKVDYSRGVDLSWYRNIPVPTSYMASRSDYDFMGGYDHGRQAGILHVADHHVSPGKKLWTWGAGEFGKAWERNLTDSDGPYIELMTGVFSDNQPDFTWMRPGETKRFEQYFMPFAAIGSVKNASRDAAITLEQDASGARIGLYSTRRRRWRVRLLRRPAGLEPVALFEATRDVGPENPFTLAVALGHPVPEEELELHVSSGGAELAYCAAWRRRHPFPRPATAPPPPSGVSSIEELFLIGLHLEQYRHATFRPEDYYREALRRDGGDSRANTALGLLLLRRGLFAESVPYFQRAIERILELNGNPPDCGAYLYLGYALELDERYDEAAEAYHKATWDGATRSQACVALASLACRRSDFEACLAFAGTASGDRRAGFPGTIALRKLGRMEEALAAADAALDEDPLDAAALHERLLVAREAERSGRAVGLSAAEALERLERALGDGARNSIELAFRYASCGRFEEGFELLGRLSCAEDPLACYARAAFAERLGRSPQARELLARAERLPPGTCFPNQIEAIGILDLAGRLNPSGAKSFYYLGNLWYNNRCYDRARAAWRRSAELDPGFPTVHRNLALAAFNKARDPAEARAELERAFDLDRTDARVLFELDQLDRRLARPPEERLDRLDRFPALVASRDDLTLERLTLLNVLARHREALAELLGRRFHPWEGGEGKVARQYVAALLGLAKAELRSGGAERAAALAERALSLPESTGEGKLAGTLDSDVHYYRGCALDAAGRKGPARDALELASAGELLPASSAYYNDQPADMIFFQGLALARLARFERARERFRSLVDYGESHRGEEPSIDYFAVSLPDFLLFDDDLARRNAIFCTYLRSLGTLGLAAIDGRPLTEARSLLAEVVAMEPAHAGAIELLRDIEAGWRFP